MLEIAAPFRLEIADHQGFEATQELCPVVMLGDIGPAGRGVARAELGILEEAQHRASEALAAPGD